MKNVKLKNKKGFSLIELIIVVAIIGVLSVVSYIMIERSRSKALNDKMLDDLIAIANSLEDFKRDHNMKYPVPEPGGNMNVLCYYADATYAHSCDECDPLDDTKDCAAFRQGMVDNNLLTKRYLREVPMDPFTGSRYVYGVTNDGKYFQVAGIFRRDDGTYEARTVENLTKGFELPSIIRAYDSANFVTDKETYLPYSPDFLVLTGTLDNIIGTVKIKTGAQTLVAGEGVVLRNGDTVITEDNSDADIFFSDGSFVHMDPGSELVLDKLEVAKNDKDGTFTKIILNLKLGKIWSKVVRLASGSTFDVKTTGAIAGVRGTECGFEVPTKDSQLKTVECVSGKVEINKLVDDKAGELIATLYVPPEIPATPLAPKTPKIPKKLELTDKPDIYLASDMEPAELEEVESEYYNLIPLNSGIRPYIISAKYDQETKLGKLTVRNINHFVNITSYKLQIPDEKARRINANVLAVYDLKTITKDPVTGKPVFGKPVITPKTDLLAQGTLRGPYEISGLPIDNKYVLRFETWKQLTNVTSEVACNEPGTYWYAENSTGAAIGKCYKRMRTSRISIPPVEMKTDTDLSEEVLYPNLFKGGVTDLILKTVPYFSLKEEAGVFKKDSFILNAEMTPLQMGYTYKVEPSMANAGVSLQPCVVKLGEESGAKKTTDPEFKKFSVNFESTTTGTCAIKVTATLDNKVEIIREIKLQVVKESDKLTLVYPNPDPLAKPVFQAGNAITFKWMAPSAPAGPFNLFVKQPGGVKYPIANLISTNYHTYTPPASINGEFEWTVELFTTVEPPVLLDTKSAKFDIAQKMMVDFTVIDTNLKKEILLFGTNKVAVAAPPHPSIISLKIVGDPPTLPAGYKYDWAYSPNIKNFNINSPDTPQSPSAQIDASGVNPNSPIKVTITLTVRDDKGNPAGPAMTKNIDIYPKLEKIGFFPPSQSLDPNATSYTIDPDLALRRDPEQDYKDLLKYCEPLTVSPLPATINGTTVLFNQPCTGTCTYTVTCVIKPSDQPGSPKIIYGYFVSELLTAELILEKKATSKCGDSQTQLPEQCDDGPLNGQPTKCNYNCTGIDVTPKCGDSGINFEYGEECDGTAMPNTECKDKLGLQYKGKLTCKTDTCKYDITGCTKLQEISSITFAEPNQTVASGEPFNFSKIKGQITGGGETSFYPSKCDEIILTPNLGQVIGDVYEAPTVQNPTIIEFKCTIFGYKIKGNISGTDFYFPNTLSVPATETLKMTVTPGITTITSIDFDTPPVSYTAVIGGTAFDITNLIKDTTPGSQTPPFSNTKCKMISNPAYGAITLTSQEPYKWIYTPPSPAGGAVPSIIPITCKIFAGTKIDSTHEIGTEDVFTSPLLINLVKNEPGCGNNVKDGEEECDEGALNGRKGHCNYNCTGVDIEPFCGDGIKQDLLFGEGCDNGAENGMMGSCNYICKNKSEKPVCGDYSVDIMFEQCDGSLPSDSNCEKATGISGATGTVNCYANSEPNRCRYDTSQCSVLGCGNGTKEGVEECDDNNKISGDGCSSTCKLEPGSIPKNTFPYFEKLPVISKLAFNPPTTIPVNSEGTVTLPNIKANDTNLFNLSKCDYLVTNPPKFGVISVSGGIYKYTAPKVIAATPVEIICKMVNGKIKLSDDQTPKNYYVQLAFPNPQYAKVFVTVSPPCGNGVVDAGEDCDGTNLDGKACWSVYPLVAPYGNLACYPPKYGDPNQCKFKLPSSETCSSTVPNSCGNITLEPEEPCQKLSADPSKFHPGETCATVTNGLKLYGNLACKTGCIIDASGCSIAKTSSVQTACVGPVSPNMEEVKDGQNVLVGYKNTAKHSYYEIKSNQCWAVASDSGQNCINACKNVYDSSAFGCSDAEDWTLDGIICPALGYKYIADLWNSDYSPILVSVMGILSCKNDTDNIRDCTKSAIVPRLRICKCNKL